MLATYMYLVFIDIFLLNALLSIILKQPYPKIAYYKIGPPEPAWKSVSSSFFQLSVFGLYFVFHRTSSMDIIIKESF